MNKKILSIVICLVCMIGLVGCGSSSTSSSNTKTGTSSNSSVSTGTSSSSTSKASSSSSSSASSSTPTTGKSVTLSDDALFCSSKDNVDKMISYMRANNKSGQDGMYQRGEAVVLKKGTTVNVVKSGIVTEVETSSGRRLFAPMEMVK